MGDSAERGEEEVEEEGNPNRPSARQELPFLTLPSAQDSEEGGGEGRERCN